jgi:hypothetical protein
MVTAGAEWSIIARSCNRSSSPPAIHRHDTNPTIPLLSLWEKWGNNTAYVLLAEARLAFLNLSTSSNQRG